MLRHLRSCGYDISQSTLYRHVADGKLRKGTGGVYTPTMLRKYVRDVGLVRTMTADGQDDAGDGGEMSADMLAEEKLRAEVAKLRAQAERERLKAEREAGRLIEREDLYLELAARAVVINTGFRQMVAVTMADVIAAVHGDPLRQQEAEDILVRAWDDMISEYARRDRFEVLFERDDDGMEDVGAE